MQVAALAFPYPAKIGAGLFEERDALMTLPALRRSMLGMSLLLTAAGFPAVAQSGISTETIAA
ncbi:MAG: hypothetical protein B7Y31_05530, partial [Novosphingobium sp. 16-62-11]